MNTVKNYYHKVLYDHPEAIEYLKKRGLNNAEHYERFQVGFSDGHLNLVIGEKQRQKLIEAGVLSENPDRHRDLQEFFRNCLVFPIFDDNGQTVGLYGRSILDDSAVGERSRTIKHRYLKGKHRGILNRKASKIFDEVILTECIIDALSLLEIGLENVQPLYGTNGFTEEHLQTLKADRVKTVVLALDNDEAGKRAASNSRKILLDEGLKSRLFHLMASH